MLPALGAGLSAGVLAEEIVLLKHDAVAQVAIVAQRETPCYGLTGPGRFNRSQRVPQRNGQFDKVLFDIGKPLN